MTNAASKVAYVGKTEDHDARITSHFQDKSEIINNYKSNWDLKIISKLKFNNRREPEDLEKYYTNYYKENEEFD